MLERWFDARGVIGRRDFVAETSITFLIGSLGFLAYFLATAPAYSFGALGHMLDHRPLALATMEPVWAVVSLTLWLAQILALAMLSAKRLRDMGLSGWLACLSLAPGVQVLFWLVLCVWPAKRRHELQAA